MSWGLPDRPYIVEWKNMGFNRFQIILFIRLTLAVITLSVAIIIFYEKGYVISSVLLFTAFIIQFVLLFVYVSKTNKQLSTFLNAIRFADFTTAFVKDTKLDHSFNGLNKSLNDVMSAFRDTRAEKEELLLYLQTVVHHITTGILAFDTEGKINLINSEAKRLLQMPQIHNIDQLKDKDEKLYNGVIDLKVGEHFDYRANADVNLIIRAAQLKQSGKLIKVLAIQNIQAELQKKEAEAWQNLTKVLRHEIMNSITPIASLADTMQQIISEDTVRKNGSSVIPNDSIEDIKEGLFTITSRSKGLAKFVNAYREYTNIPKPDIENVDVCNVVNNVKNLHLQKLNNQHISFEFNCMYEHLKVKADKEMLERVIINLVKNAIEALKDIKDPKISITSGLDENSKVFIKVRDNGPGLNPDVQERIFIPFYTTKKEGSGIGLAMVRQIVQMHNGTINLSSVPNEKTEFTIVF